MNNKLINGKYIVIFENYDRIIGLIKVMWMGNIFYLVFVNFLIIVDRVVNYYYSRR